MKFVNPLLVPAEYNMIEQRSRGGWVVRQGAHIHKFSTEQEAKDFLNQSMEGEGSDAKKEKFETKTSRSDGIQQTKAYTRSPEKKSHRGGKSWNKD